MVTRRRKFWSQMIPPTYLEHIFFYLLEQDTPCVCFSFSNVLCHDSCKTGQFWHQDIYSSRDEWKILCRDEECELIVRRAGLLWSQQDFEWRWSVPLFKCLTVLEFSFILFDLCLLITFFNSIMNYVPIVTFWIFTYHKIWILSIMFCFIWSYWIIYFLACLEVSWRVVS